MRHGLWLEPLQQDLLGRLRRLELNPVSCTWNHAEIPLRVTIDQAAELEATGWELISCSRY